MGIGCGSRHGRRWVRFKGLGFRGSQHGPHCKAGTGGLSFQGMSLCFKA